MLINVYIMNVIFKTCWRNKNSVVHKVKNFSLTNWFTKLYEVNLEPNLNCYLIWLSKQSSIKRGLIYLLTIYSPFILANLSPGLLQTLTNLVWEGIDSTSSSWLTLGDSPRSYRYQNYKMDFIDEESILEGFPKLYHQWDNMIDTVKKDLNSRKFLTASETVSKENATLDKIVESSLLRLRLDEDLRNFLKVRDSLYRWLRFIHEERMLRSHDEAEPLNLMGVLNWEEQRDNLDFLIKLASYSKQGELLNVSNLYDFLKLNVKDNLSRSLRSLGDLGSSDNLDKFVQSIIDNVKLNDHILKLREIDQEIQVSLNSLTETLKEMNLLSETGSSNQLHVDGWVDHMLTFFKNVRLSGNEIDYQNLKKNIVDSHNQHLDKILNLIDGIETQFSNSALIGDRDLNPRQQKLVRDLVNLRDSSNEHKVLCSFPLDSDKENWDREPLIHDPKREPSNNKLRKVQDTTSYMDYHLNSNHLTSMKLELIRKGSSLNDGKYLTNQKEKIIQNYLDYLDETLTKIELIITESFNDNKYTWWEGHYSLEDKGKLEFIKELNSLKESLSKLFNNQSNNSLTIHNRLRWIDWNTFISSLEGKVTKVNELLHTIIGQEQSQVVKVFNEIDKVRNLANKAKKI